MKRLISALLCIVMLAGLFGCKPTPQPPVDPTPPQTGAPTPGQSTKEPKPTPTPTDSPTVPPEEEPELVYSNEELGVNIYSAQKDRKIIIHYGDLTQEIENFSYNYFRPDFEVWLHDGDGDGTDELYIIHTIGSGTGVSEAALLVCEPNGSRLDCRVHDWNPIADSFNAQRMASYDEVTGLVSVTYGNRALAVLFEPGRDCKNPATITGEQVHYIHNEDGTVGLVFALAMTENDRPMSEFHGMSLFLSLCFDGTDMVPVTEPQLGLDYGAKFSFSVTPVGVYEELPEDFYADFLLDTPVGQRNFSGLHAIGISAPMELYLADLTGDGADEFIVILFPGFGVGPDNQDPHIFDGVTLEEYDVSEILSVLPDFTTFASDEHNYYIDAANLLISIPKEDVQAALPNAELLNAMSFNSMHTQISANRGTLCLNYGCVVNDPWDCYGTLSATLIIKDGTLAVDEVFYTAPDGTVIRERQTEIYFQNVLQNGVLENWYLAAMGSIYDTPAAIDLDLVFYNGFSGCEVTPEEKAYLLEQGFSEHIAMHKLPAKKLDEVLNTYFGISLYDVTIPADWIYYPETDCYYSSHNDAYLVHGFDVMQVNVTDDGLIELHYYVEPYRGAFDPVTGWSVVYGILTLRQNGQSPLSPEGLTVLSNRPAAPVDALLEDGVFLYALPDGRLFLQDGDTAGPVTYVNDCNAKQPGCYDLSQITITRKELLHDWEGEPLYNVILLNLLGGEPTENVELRWAEETGTWELSLRASNQPDLGGEVTKDTIPTDPKQFYKVAHSGVFVLYARNHGLESLLTWEGNFWWYLGERTAHTGHFNLPVMIPMDDHDEGVMDSVAVISEVQTGTQTGVDELIVYQVADIQAEDGSWYMGLKDYIYDWRPVAKDFNRSNTIVYDKDTNSIVLYWNDEIYFTGTLPEDQSAYLGLEDGFTGALIASGQIVRYIANPDGSFTITMQTCVGRGGGGHFSEDLSDPFWYGSGDENRCYPLSVGTTGFELSWTVNFTGEGFETADVTVAKTGGENILLRAALPSEDIYLFRKPGLESAENYLLMNGQVSVLDSNQSFGDLIADFRLCDLDGDGDDEIAVVGNLYAGGGYSSILTVLDKTADGWIACEFLRDGADYELMETAVFTSAGDPNHVILSLEGFQFLFSVSDEVAARSGDYFASGAQLSTVIAWDEDGYYLHLPGAVYRDDPNTEWPVYDECGVQFALRCKLEYDGSTITRIPVGITPPYTHFTVTQRGENLFELASEQGFVQFEGIHLPGEEIVTKRRDLDLDGVEEFIVLLVSGRSDTSVHQDAYVFDGRTLEQVDTSDLWSVAQNLFVFIGDSEMFHIHCDSFRQPLYKKDILALYPDIEFLDKVEFWGNRSSISVMFDHIEVSYECIVGEGGESFGSLQVWLMVEDGQLVPFQIVYLSDSLYKTYQLAPSHIPGPFIGE